MIIARRDPALIARIVEASPIPGVRSGSALVRVGERLLAVQDDAFTIVWIDPASLSLEPLVLAGAGGPLPKPEKPDFEAALVTQEGLLYVLGSGSTAKRRWIARLDVAKGTTDLVDAGPLYDALEGAVGVTPNIEGVILHGRLARLFHRGSGYAPGASASMDVPAEALDGSPTRVLSMTRYDLGAIGRTPLTFTDATPLDGGLRALYLAVAEDTPDAIADGPIMGAAVGVIGPEGVRFALLVEADGAPCTRKPEGITLDPGERSGFLLTDPDSAGEPAELCRFILEGPW